MQICLKFRKKLLQEIDWISINVNFFWILFFQVGSCKTQHMVYKNLKFASGEKEMVQKDILIIQYSLVIGLYKEACKNVNYDALSDSSLWNITN